MDEKSSEDEVSPHIKAQIDRGLKLVFEKIAEEELPTKLQKLIDELAQNAKPTNDGTSQ